MSEQTPDASGSMADSHEPSMEDILASIRKIIADDDGGQAAEASLDTETPGFADLSPDLVIDEGSDDDVLDLEIIANPEDIEIPEVEGLVSERPSSKASGAVSDIELLLSDDEEMTSAVMENEAPDVLDLDVVLDEPKSTTPETVTPETGTQEPDTGEMATERADDDAYSEVLSILEDDIAEVTAKDSAEVETAPDISQPLESDDDLSLMLDNVLSDETLISDEMIVDPAADLLAVTETDGAEEVVSSGDADIDLVKSLMADLTEEPLYEGGDLDDAELEIPDINAALKSEDADVMDEILSMTLDDETRLQEESNLADAAIQNENTVDEPAITDHESADNSLLAIAAEAQADAAALETGETSGQSAMSKGVAGAAVLGAAAAAGTVLTPPEDDVEATIDKLDSLLEESESSETDLDIPEPTSEETPEMPRAASKDTIIDEVTETATADVFSSLNKVVEEKATVAERGDRIGDLVMEALRPMLKDWLDANLKGIVERAVTKEVKRISSGK